MASTPMNLFQFAMTHPSDGFERSSDLAVIMNAIGSAGKLISSEVNRAALRDVFGAAGSSNLSGDEQQKLDIIGDNAVADALAATGLVTLMASEENDGLISVPGIARDGMYGVVFDPVDGSGNIDVAAPIGTIFGVYRRSDASAAASEKELLRPGREMVAAGYVLYGSSTILAYTSGDGVHFFTLDPVLGDFLLTDEEVVSHGSSDVYSTNEGNSHSWHQADLDWVADVKSKGYSGRYIGALVADFHRNLLKGGIYVYPGDRGRPDGKLRLLYECAPLAFIAEQCGGAASNGEMRILDIEPEHLHHRTPLYIGSADQVALLESFHKG